jgi:hypothetical protein
VSKGPIERALTSVALCKTVGVKGASVLIIGVDIGVGTGKRRVTLATKLCWTKKQWCTSGSFCLKASGSNARFSNDDNST